MKARQWYKAFQERRDLWQEFCYMWKSVVVAYLHPEWWDRL